MGTDARFRLMLLSCIACACLGIEVAKAQRVDFGVREAAGVRAVETPEGGLGFVFDVDFPGVPVIDASAGFFDGLRGFVEGGREFPPPWVCLALASGGPTARSAVHLAGELGIDESVHGAFRAFGEWKELSTPRLALLMRLAAEQGYTSTMPRIQDVERSELQGLRARVLGSLMRQIDPTEMPESDPHRERSAIAGMPAGIVRWVRIQVRDQDAVRTLADAWADSRALTMDRSLRAQGAAATSPAAVTHHAQLAVAADAIAWRLFVEIGPWFLEDLVVGIDGDRRLHGHAIVDCDFERCAAAWQALGGTGRLVLRDGHKVGFAGTLDPWVVRLGIDDEVLRSIAAESKDLLQPIAEPALADGDAVRIGFADHRTPALGDLRAFALVLGSGASDATVDFASATEAAAERLREPLLSGGTWRALQDPMPGWLRETGASAVTSGRAPLRFLLLALVDLEARQH